MTDKGLWEEITKDFNWYKWPIILGVIYLITFFVPFIFQWGMAGFTFVMLISYPSVLLLQYLDGWRFGLSETGFLLYLAVTGTVFYALIGFCVGFFVRIIVVIRNRIHKSFKM